MANSGANRPPQLYRDPAGGALPTRMTQQLPEPAEPSLVIGRAASDEAQRAEARRRRSPLQW